MNRECSKLLILLAKRKCFESGFWFSVKCIDESKRIYTCNICDLKFNFNESIFTNYSNKEILYDHGFFHLKESKLLPFI